MKESFLSKLNPLELTELLPDESPRNLSSANESSTFTSPAETISSQCSSQDLSKRQEDQSANFYYLSPSNLTFPPSQGSREEDSRSVFPELREDIEQGPIPHSKGAGLFDKVIFGSAINFSKNKPIEPPPESSDLKMKSKPSRVYMLNSEAEAILNQKLGKLNIGMNTVLSDCLIIHEASPYATALFLSNKISKMLDAKLSSSKLDSIKIPCIPSVIDSLDKIFSYTGPLLGNLQFSISSASIICTVLILDICKFCTQRCLKIDPTQIELMKSALISAYAKLVISTDSPSFSKRQGNWLLSSTKDERPLNEPQLTTRDLVKVLKDNYLRNSYDMLEEVLAEYPGSESDEENYEISSPPFKKSKQGAFKENREPIAEASLVPTDPKAQLQEFLSAPKIVVTSRTDGKGILGRKLVPAPSPIKSNASNTNAPLKRKSLGDIENMFLSPNKLQGIIIPSTPLSDM